MKLLEKLCLHRPELRAWAMYDWANSSFATTIMAVVLPIYYFDVAASSLEPNIRTAYWGYTAATALLLVSLSAPILGAIADHYAAKKKFLIMFLALGVIGSAGLFWVKSGDWFWASCCFIVGNIGFAGGNIFYESLLPHIASDEELDKVSLAGYAVGYLGGGALLAINLWWITGWESIGFPDKGFAVRACFASVAVWWLLFSLPILIKVPEPPSKTKTHPSTDGKNPVRIAVARLRDTFSHLRRYKNLLMFLIAFWLFSDGIGTIIKMATTYGREIGIDQGSLIAAMLVVQLLGMPFTFAFGPIAKFVGTKRALLGTLIVYAIICVFGYYMQTAAHFWILAVLVATVQGGCQALSRSIYASMIPRSRSAEFFSFYSVSSKFAGVAGPFLFGLISTLTGGSRASILFLISFFALGFLLVRKVDVKKGQMEALHDS